ncbi:MAG: GGDEF domain-containing protein [Candidatus Pacearchaeota archaeon]|nr:MAG: GGDEF domain-containing protein [Candidatus Pacearchaeota archaeon]
MADWLKKILGRKEDLKKGLDAKKIAKLYYLATVDTKTQLYNYRYFNSVFKHEMAIAERYGRTISMLLLDLDDFKRINDKHGYLRGDEVLQMVSMIIKSNVRETDVAARFGGEEFVVLMPETPSEDAKNMAERIRKFIQEDKFLASFNLTASIGVASHNKKTELATSKMKSAYEKFMPKSKNGKRNGNLDLFEKANIALRYAKEHGKNCYMEYDDISKISFLEKIEKQFVGDKS